MHRTPLGEDRILLVEQRGTRNADGAGITITELAGWRSGSPAVSAAAGICSQAAPRPASPPAIGYRSDDVLAVQALAAAGQGVTLLPELAPHAHCNPVVRTGPLSGRFCTLQLWTAGGPAAPAVRLGHETVAAAP